MSETKHYTGKLIKLNKIKGETLDQQCERLYTGNGTTDKYYTIRDLLQDEFGDKYIIISGNLYEVIKNELDPYDDIFKIENDIENGYKFEVKYYNGGCCFIDAIETAMIEKYGKITNDK